MAIKDIILGAKKYDYDKLGIFAFTEIKDDKLQLGHIMNDYSIKKFFDRADISQETYELNSMVFQKDNLNILFHDIEKATKMLDFKGPKRFEIEDYAKAKASELVKLYTKGSDDVVKSGIELPEGVFERIVDSMPEEPRRKGLVVAAIDNGGNVVYQAEDRLDIESKVLNYFSLVRARLLAKRELGKRVFVKGYSSDQVEVAHTASFLLAYSVGTMLPNNFGESIYNELAVRSMGENLILAKDAPMAKKYNTITELVKDNI